MEPKQHVPFLERLSPEQLSIFRANMDKLRAYGEAKHVIEKRASVKIWNPRPPFKYRLKVWWCRLWIRRDEFHYTLNSDTDMLLHMCECERRRYWTDIGRRRRIAHERTQ